LKLEAVILEKTDEKDLPVNWLVFYFSADYDKGEVKINEEGEAVYRGYFKKALVASCNIQEGEIITKEMMYAMRPKAFTDGIGSERYEDVLGKKTNKLVARYDPISPEDLVGFRE